MVADAKAGLLLLLVLTFALEWNHKFTNYFYVRISRQWNSTLNATLTTIAPTILHLFALFFLLLLLFFVDPPPVLVPADPCPWEGVHDAKQLQLDAGSLLKVGLLRYDLGSVWKEKSK